MKKNGNFLFANGKEEWKLKMSSMISGTWGRAYTDSPIINAGSHRKANFIFSYLR